MSEHRVQAAAGRVYGQWDWLAAAITFVVSLAGYFLTLAPSVTFERSAEWITAAHTLGVPQAPGFPLWTMLAWLWSLAVPVGNVAWRLNLFSAVCGAAACGLVTLVVSRSGREMLQGMDVWETMVAARVQFGFVMAGAVTGGLLLAFGTVMWTQSVVASPHGLNLLFVAGVLAVLYGWSFQPERRWRLFLAAGLWGLSLGAHPSSVLLAAALPFFVWLMDRGLGRDLLAPVLVILLAAAIWVLTRATGLFVVITVLCVGFAAGAGLYWLTRQGAGWGRNWRTVAGVYGVAAGALCSYFYLPIAASGNPPINSFELETVGSFVRLFAPAAPDRSALLFWNLTVQFFNDLQAQFNVLYVLLSLVLVFFFREVGQHQRRWLYFLFAAFLSLGPGLVVVGNLSATENAAFLAEHAIYAMWIAYGLMLGAALVLRHWNHIREVAFPLTAIMFLLPAGSVWLNWKKNDQRGHVYGYELGYRMFRPEGGYEEIDRNAVLFTGTDDGRFVPSYLVFVESQMDPGKRSRIQSCPGSAEFDRRDVALISQNTLAEPYYRQVLRQQYGEGRALGEKQVYPNDQLWIPSESDEQRAAQQYAAELRQRPAMPGEGIQFDKAGQIRPMGPLGALAMNGNLTRMIFERNKQQHTFYVTESYSLPWMFPYMEPFGLIMRLNQEPMAELSAEIVACDREYWDKVVKDLLGDSRFARDPLARQTYAKLRAGSGGLYAWRRMTAEAEYALRQALALSPENADANFRLAKLLAESGRSEESLAVLEKYRQLNPYDGVATEVIRTLREARAQEADVLRLERDVATQPENFRLSAELAWAYARQRNLEALKRHVDRMLTQDLSVADFLLIAQVYADLQDVENLLKVAQLMVQRHPQSSMAWYTLGRVYGASSDCTNCIASLEKALTYDSTDGQIRNLIETDIRLNNCRTDPAFAKLLFPLVR
jgi:tetratricopeptide (TPR) repeat protein